MTSAVLAFGFGPLEIGVILLVVLLVFGPSKLPQLGEGVGKMLRGFKKEMKALDEEKKADEAAAAGSDAASDEIDVTPKGEKKADKDKASA